MSTRGAIARQTGDGFTGRYHHWDSYPSGLGKTLWELYRNQFGKDIDQMLKVLIDDHPAGWSTIVGKDFTLPSGFLPLGSEEGNPQCYCHGDRKEEEQTVTDKDASAIGVEYAYVFHNSTMSIMASFTRKGNKMIGMFGMGNPDAYWRLVAIFDLNGEEPDWEAIH